MLRSRLRQDRHRQDGQFWALLSLFFAALVCLATPDTSRALEPPEPFTIFAAASLGDALADAAETYTTRYPDAKATFSLSGSGILARQIVAGAPAHIYLSADKRWVDYLADQGLAEAKGATLIAGNRLIVLARPELKLSGTMGDMLVQIARNETGRIAIGDPATVPAGHYGRQALQGLGIWKMVEPALVPTASVRNAVALVQRGEVEAAIVYQTDAALAPQLKRLGTFLPGLHTPITYWAVVLNGAPWTAYDFLVQLGSEDGKTILTSHGFITP